MITITETDIIEARKRVAANPMQQDFKDALLASPDLQPYMIKEWLDSNVQVRWCACPEGDHSRIVCTECGLPPYWRSKVEAEQD